jgi:hypothetical protein
VPLVLLIIDAEQEDYHGFKPRLWADVCTELRHIARRTINAGDYLFAAMILAFVAMVEQNLLDIRIPAVPAGISTDDIATGFRLQRVADQLSRFLEKL